MADLRAPAAVAMLTQANTAWPDRRRTSDGIVPSPQHTAANPYSDHEVGKAGYHHAVDLSHDVPSGCDCGKIAEAIRLARDTRVKYVIFNRRIFSSTVSPWVWRPYTGSSPHTAHMHVSIVDTRAACIDTSQWPGIPRKETQVPETVPTDIPVVPGARPVFRLYNKVDHDHFYTASREEANTILKNTDWHYEGIAFWTIDVPRWVKP